jgi:hypothetical protein
MLLIGREFTPYRDFEFIFDLRLICTTGLAIRH